MTPLTFAGNLAKSDNPDDRALAVAIVTRGLTDDDPVTHRAGWPLNEIVVARAAAFLGLPDDPTLIAAALALAPTVSDAMLNKGAATR